MEMHAIDPAAVSRPFEAMDGFPRPGSNSFPYAPAGRKKLLDVGSDSSEGFRVRG